jgi:hypothetical protein
MRLKGNDAIEYAREHDLTLCKYNDPTEDAREDLTPEEAEKIALEDPSLIYIEVEGQAIRSAKEAPKGERLMNWIEDDSDVIDVIEGAKTAWFEAHPECDTPTDESTDECINRALGLPPGGAIRPLAEEFADWTQDDVSEMVANGLDKWWNRQREARGVGRTASEGGEMTRLEGLEAIEYAREHDLTLCKYEDPTEDAREGLTVEEAVAVACEDPSLIYIDRAVATA